VRGPHAHRASASDSYSSRPNGNPDGNALGGPALTHTDGHASGDLYSYGHAHGDAAGSHGDGNAGPALPYSLPCSALSDAHGDSYAHPDADLRRSRPGYVLPDAHAHADADSPALRPGTGRRTSLRDGHPDSRRPGTGYRMRRAVTPVLLLVALGGCALKPPEKVATSMNAFDFYEARYEEKCQTASPDCERLRAALSAWRKHLIEANRAVKNGGRCPLQLQQIADDEKGVERGR